MPEGSASPPCVQVCLSGRGRAERVSVCARMWKAEGTQCGDIVASRREAPGRRLPSHGSQDWPGTSPTALGWGAELRVPWGARGAWGLRAVAVPGALELSLRAVTERRHGNPRTWQSSRSDWPGAEEVAPRVPPSPADSSATRACSSGPQGFPAWCRGGFVVWFAERVGTVYVCVCVRALARVRVWHVCAWCSENSESSQITGTE